MKSLSAMIARAIALAVVAAPALAALNVFATVPEWGALAEELGGDKVNVYTATNALQDPHHVEAKPSLIARARSADLVVATGAELEIGWLPLVHAAGGQSEDPARQARLLRGGGATSRCSKSRRASTAPRATSIPAAIRTSRPIRATSRASPGRSRRGWPSSIPPTPRTTRRATRRSPSAGTRRSRTGRSRRRRCKGVPIVVQHKAFTYLDRWLGLKRSRGARAQARRRADDRAPDRSARDAAAAAGRRW